MFDMHPTKSPESRAIHRRANRIEIIVGILSATVFAVIAVGFGIHHQSSHAATNVTTRAAITHLTTDPLDGYGLTDQAMATRINELRAQHPGAYTGNPVTATNLRSYVVPWVCRNVAQVDPPMPANGNAKTWPAFWHDLSALVVSSGRCSR